MTALSAERNTPVMDGNDVLVDSMYIPLAAGAKVYKGGIVALNSSGYGIAGSTSALTVVGRAEKTVDNTSGSNGDLSVEVRRGSFKYANSATTDALSQADVGRECFLVDDQTIARTSSAGARPMAGRVTQVDTDGVWVELGVQRDPSIREVLLLAGADLSALQYTFVKVNSSGAVIAASAAGEGVRGVLQNAPASGAVAIVRTNGPSKVVGSAAINPGVDLATTATGTSKAASLLVQATGAASYAMGWSLTACSGAAAQHNMMVHPMGALPTSAA
jgi:hypothetical protein